MPVVFFDLCYCVVKLDCFVLLHTCGVSLGLSWLFVRCWLIVVWYDCCLMFDYLFVLCFVCCAMVMLRCGMRLMFMRVVCIVNLCCSGLCLLCFVYLAI